MRTAPTKENTSSTQPPSRYIVYVVVAGPWTYTRNLLRLQQAASTKTERVLENTSTGSNVCVMEKESVNQALEYLHPVQACFSLRGDIQCNSFD